MSGRRIAIALSPRTILLAIAGIALGWAVVSVRA